MCVNNNSSPQTSMYDRVLYFLLVSSKYMSCDGSMHMFHNFFFDLFLPHLVGFKFGQTSYICAQCCTIGTHVWALFVVPHLQGTSKYFIPKNYEF